MPLIETFVRFLRIGICLLLPVAPLLAAEEIAPEFRADLLHVASPIHITPDVPINVASGVLEEQGPVKATIAPIISLRSLNLPGKVFDVSGPLQRMGLALPKGSRALYSPEAQLLYVRSVEDDLVKAVAMFYTEKQSREFTLDVKATVISGKREATLIDAKSIPLIEGRKVELSSSGQESIHLAIQPYIGTVLYDELLELGIDAEVSAGGQSITMNNIWLTHHTKPVAATLGKLGETTVTLSVQVHSHQGRWGDDAESEKEGKAAAIRKIEEELTSPQK